MSRVEITREQYEKLRGTNVCVDMVAQYFIDPSGMPHDVPRGTQGEKVSFKRVVKRRGPTSNIAIKAGPKWNNPWQFPEASQVILTALSDKTSIPSRDLAALVANETDTTPKRASYIVGRLLTEGRLGIVCD